MAVAISESTRLPSILVFCFPLHTYNKATGSFGRLKALIVPPLSPFTSCHCAYNETRQQGNGSLPNLE